jgi:hypothetical protein
MRNWRPFSGIHVIFGMAMSLLFWQPRRAFLERMSSRDAIGRRVSFAQIKSTSDDRTDMASANIMAELSPVNQPYDEVGKVILSVRGLSHSFGGPKAVQCQL